MQGGLGDLRVSEGGAFPLLSEAASLPRGRTPSHGHMSTLHAHARTLHTHHTHTAAQGFTSRAGPVSQRAEHLSLVLHLGTSRP